MRVYAFDGEWGLTSDTPPGTPVETRTTIAGDTVWTDGAVVVVQEANGVPRWVLEDIGETVYGVAPYPTGEAYTPPDPVPHNLYVLTATRLFHFTVAGELLATHTVPFAAVDGTPCVAATQYFAYVGFKADIYRVDHTDGFLDPATAFGNISAMCAGAGVGDGTIFVGDSVAGTVVSLTYLDDPPVPGLAWPVSGTTPRGGVGRHAIGPDGLLYGVNPVLHRLEVVNPTTGAWVRSIGGYGSGAGIEFDTPSDVRVDAAGDLWVADTGNQRLVVLEYTEETEGWGLARTVDTTPFAPDRVAVAADAVAIADSAGAVVALYSLAGVEQWVADTTAPSAWDVAANIVSIEEGGATGSLLYILARDEGTVQVWASPAYWSAHPVTPCLHRYTASDFGGLTPALVFGYAGKARACVLCETAGSWQVAIMNLYDTEGPGVQRWLAEVASPGGGGPGWRGTALDALVIPRVGGDEWVYVVNQVGIYYGGSAYRWLGSTGAYSGALGTNAVYIGGVKHGTSVGTGSSLGFYGLRTVAGEVWALSTSVVYAHESLLTDVVDLARQLTPGNETYFLTTVLEVQVFSAAGVFSTRIFYEVYPPVPDLSGIAYTPFRDYGFDTFESEWAVITDRARGSVTTYEGPSDWAPFRSCLGAGYIYWREQARGDGAEEFRDLVGGVADFAGYTVVADSGNKRLYAIPYNHIGDWLERRLLNIDAGEVGAGDLSVAVCDGSVYVGNRAQDAIVQYAAATGELEAYTEAWWARDPRQRSDAGLVDLCVRGEAGDELWVVDNYPNRAYRDATRWVGALWRLEAARAAETVTLGGSGLVAYGGAYAADGGPAGTGGTTVATVAGLAQFSTVWALTGVIGSGDVPVPDYVAPAGTALAIAASEGRVYVHDLPGMCLSCFSREGVLLWRRPIPLHGAGAYGVWTLLGVSAGETADEDTLVFPVMHGANTGLAIITPETGAVEVLRPGVWDDSGFTPAAAQKFTNALPSVLPRYCGILGGVGAWYSVDGILRAGNASPTTEERCVAAVNVAGAWYQVRQDRYWHDYAGVVYGHGPVIALAYDEEEEEGAGAWVLTAGGTYGWVQRWVGGTVVCQWPLPTTPLLAPDSLEWYAYNLGGSPPTAAAMPFRVFVQPQEDGTVRVGNLVFDPSGQCVLGPAQFAGLSRTGFIDGMQDYARGLVVGCDADGYAYFTSPAAMQSASPGATDWDDPTESGPYIVEEAMLHRLAEGGGWNATFSIADEGDVGVFNGAVLRDGTIALFYFCVVDSVTTAYLLHMGADGEELSRERVPFNVQYLMRTTKSYPGAGWATLVFGLHTTCAVSQEYEILSAVFTPGGVLVTSCYTRFYTVYGLADARVPVVHGSTSNYVAPFSLGWGEYVPVEGNGYWYAGRVYRTGGNWYVAVSEYATDGAWVRDLYVSAPIPEGVSPYGYYATRPCIPRAPAVSDNMVALSVDGTALHVTIEASPQAISGGATICYFGSPPAVPWRDYGVGCYGWLAYHSATTGDPVRRIVVTPPGYTTAIDTLPATPFPPTGALVPSYDRWQEMAGGNYYPDDEGPCTVVQGMASATRLGMLRQSASRSGNTVSLYYDGFRAYSSIATLAWVFARVSAAAAAWANTVIRPDEDPVYPWENVPALWNPRFVSSYLTTDGTAVAAWVADSLLLRVCTFDGMTGVLGASTTGDWTRFDLFAATRDGYYAVWDGDEARLYVNGTHTASLVSHGSLAAMAAYGDVLAVLDSVRGVVTTYTTAGEPVVTIGALSVDGAERMYGLVAPVAFTMLSETRVAILDAARVHVIEAGVTAVGYLWTPPAGATAIAAVPGGDIYTHAAGVLYRHTVAGVFVGAWLVPLAGSAAGMVVRADGTVFIAATGGSVVVWAAGVVVRTFAAGGTLRGVGLAGDNVLVADYGWSRVSEYTDAGALVRAVAAPGAAGAARGADGGIYAACRETGTVRRYTATGVAAGGFGACWAPVVTSVEDIAGDAYGLLWLVNRERKEVIGMRGTDPVVRLHEFSGPDGAAWDPAAVAVRDNGDVAVYDATSARVVIYSGTQRLLAEVALDADTVYLNATMHPAGYLVVLAGGYTGGVAERTVTVMYPASGATVRSWTHSADCRAGGAVCATPDGTIWVAYSNTVGGTPQRLCVNRYSISGTLLGTWTYASVACTAGTVTLDATPSGDLLVGLCPSTVVTVYALDATNGTLRTVAARTATLGPQTPVSQASNHILLGGDTNLSLYYGTTVPVGAVHTPATGVPIGADGERLASRTGSGSLWGLTRCGSPAGGYYVAIDPGATAFCWVTHGDFGHALAGTAAVGYGYAACVLQSYTLPGVFVGGFASDEPDALCGLWRGWGRLRSADDEVDVLRVGSGVVAQVVGGHGGGTGLFDNPTDIAGAWGTYDGERLDALFVADPGNLLVQRFLGVGTPDAAGMSTAFDPVFGHFLCAYEDADGTYIHFVRAYSSVGAWSPPTLVGAGAAPGLLVEACGRYVVVLTAPSGERILRVSIDLGRTWEDV